MLLEEKLPTVSLRNPILKSLRKRATFLDNLLFKKYNYT